MITDQLRAHCRGAIGAFVLLVSFAGVAAAQTGTITGHVMAKGTTQPIPDAHVTVTGTNLGASTNATGAYRISGLKPGTYRVRALRIGYAEQQQSVTITDRQSQTVDFSLEAVATKLEGVVTTVTGQQRKIEVGNAVAQIDAQKDVATKAISKVADLLTSRAAGVQVTPALNVGGGEHRDGCRRLPHARRRARRRDHLGCKQLLRRERIGIDAGIRYSRSRRSACLDGR